MGQQKSNASKLAAKDTLIYFPMKILVGVIGFITLAQYLILFNTEEYGDYSIVNTTISWIGLLFAGWMAQSSLRYYDVYRKEQKEKQFYSTLFAGWFLVNILGVFCGAGIYYGFQNVLDPRLLSLTKYAILVFITFNTVGVANNLLRASRNTFIFTISNVLIPTGKLFLLLLLVKKFSMGIESILLSNFLVDFIFLLLLLVRFKGILKKIRLKYIDFETIRTFVKFGFPLLGLAMTSAVLSFVDRYFIRIYRGAAENGLYTAGYSIVSSAFEVFLQAFMIGLYPIILKTWNGEGKAATEELVQKAFRWYLLLMVPAGFGISAVAGTIMKLFRPEYYDARVVIPWVAMGMVVLGITQYTNKIWELMEKPSMILYFNLIAAVANVILNFIFIPRYGFIAGGYITLASYLIYLVISIIASRNLFQWSIEMHSLAKILLSGLGMFVGITWINGILGASIFSLIFMILSGGVLYFCCLFMLGEIREEIQYFKKRFFKNHRV